MKRSGPQASQEPKGGNPLSKTAQTITVRKIKSKRKRRRFEIKFWRDTVHAEKQRRP
ncbi:MAG: hypothetical protein RR133_06385 [Kiritimatiellia bacterium]